MSETTADALLVVDVQERWVEGSLIDVLAVGVAAARRAGALVVHLHDATGGGLVVEPLADELVLGKPEDDGFRGTGLDELLRATGCAAIVVTGLLAEMCVAATARGALERGYTVVWARDAVAAADVPAAGTAPAVPAAQVCRVAEWSLGDELVSVDRLEDVRFVPPGAGR